MAGVPKFLQPDVPVHFLKKQKCAPQVYFMSTDEIFSCYPHYTVIYGNIYLLELLELLNYFPPIKPKQCVKM